MKKVIKTPNIFQPTKNYANKWVALSSDYKKVVASGKTLAEVLEKTSAKERVAVFRVLPNLSYSPSQF